MKNIHNISAGAGAGKTTTLVNIITALVSEKGYNGLKCSPERMILTTFTNAAASEFRMRATAKLFSEGELAKATALGAAQIGTVDSIAQTYIMRYWYLLGISPDVTPVPEEEAKKIVSMSLDSVVAKADIAFFRKYVTEFSIMKGEGFDYDFWKDHLIKISDKVLTDGLTKENLEEMKTKSVALLEKIFDTSKFAKVYSDLSVAAGKYASFCRNTDLVDKRSQPKQARIADVLERIARSKSVSLKDIAVLDKDFDGPINVPNARHDEYQDKVDAGYVDVADLLEDVLPVEAADIIECAKKIFDIAISWADSYSDYKKSLGVIDFSDMERMFLKLLDFKEVTEDIENSIDYLFVDEFQDSNPIQIKIFDKLSDHVKQSWFVGDLKQAIYGFRGSDTALIADFSSHFPAEAKDETSCTGFTKDANGLSSQVLRESHRSVPSLVNFANEVFIQAFGSAKGGDRLSPDKVELIPVGKPESAFPTLHHIEIDKDKSYEALASAVCDILNDNYKPLKGAGFKPSDIAILVKYNEHAVNIAKALRNKGVPVNFVDTKFMESAEISLLVSLLSLASGIDRKKTIADLRRLIDDESLEDVVCDVLADKCTPEWGHMEDFFKSLRGLSVLDCVDAIVSRFDLYNFVSKWNYPESRRANIDLVRQEAREFDSTCTSLGKATDIRSFLSFLKTFEPDVKFDNTSDGVKVLSYWKAKGLEWRAVFLTDISGEVKQPGPRNLEGLNDKLFVPRLPVKEWADNAIDRTPDAVNLRDGSYDKAIGEDRRLLYVGVTRAKEFVFTVGKSESDLGWLRKCCPTIPPMDTIDFTKDNVDIWGVGFPSALAVYSDVVGQEYGKAATQASYVASAGFSLATAAPSERKYLSPSSYTSASVVKATSATKLTSVGPRMDIKHAHLEDNEFGDCIHHAFAVCTPKPDEAVLEKIARILKSYRLEAEPAQVADRFSALCTFLEQTYGPAKAIEHELPFAYTDPEGHVFNGDMDLVWTSEKGSVIVDYKTFSGTEKEALAECVSKHATQLYEYRKALAASKRNVLATLIFYPVIGTVVELKTSL